VRQSSLKFFVVLGIACSVAAFSSFAQDPAAPGGGQGQGKGQGRGGQGKGGGKGAPARPVLVLKEEWKQSAAGGEHPFSPEDISNANLDFKVYGVKTEDLLLTGTGRDGDPIHLWTGLCPTACAITLKDKGNYVDLTGLARIRWNTKVSGFHQVRPVIKLADGTLLVGSYASEPRADYLVNEFAISEVRWIRLDPDKVQTKGDFVANPDLSKVDEIGFADLTPGSGHGAGGWVDVGEINVYGKAVPRS
jgi:hypothetical protein